MRAPPEPQAPITVALDAVGSAHMVFRHVPLGGRTVRIGSRGAADERPVRKVRFADDWYLGETVVTQGQWGALMGDDHEVIRMQAFPDQVDHPVTNVSWDDAREYCRALQSRVREGLCARLPTEAEWEAACRAGSRADYAFGDGAEAIEQAGWVYETSELRTRAVTSAPDPVPPHPWGLVGMHGNVWEWCQDLYWAEVGASARPSAPEPCHVDPARFTGAIRESVALYRRVAADLDRPDIRDWIEGLVRQHGEEAVDEYFAARAGAPTRVLRGGSWGGGAANAASAYRFGNLADGRNRFIGFRVCLSPRPGAETEQGRTGQA